MIVIEKIINQKRYSTKSARCLGEVRNSALFQKKTGEYFLCDQKEKKIILISAKEAEEWAAKHLPEDAYNDLFKKGKTGSQEKVTIKIDKNAVNLLKRIQEKQGKSGGEIIEAMIYRLAEEEGL